MIFEHYLLLVLAILPLINRYSFWFFTIQLKEYRRDRFSEYLSTYQWKSALFNIWTVIEIPLIFISLIIFINPPFEIIIYNVLFVFLLIQNIFVIRKVITGKILKPKLTWRLLLTLILFLGLLIIDLLLMMFWWFERYIYTYLLILFSFAPLVIFLIIIITLPIINYFKNKKILKAIEISNKNKETIKIWITWSYGKSSIKEYLSSILEQDWKTLKTPKNINTELWVAWIIINKLDESYKYFIAEMWAYKIGEIETLWKIVNQKYWFLTAVWNQHLWLFGTQDNIKIWKAEIANNILKNNWTLYINWNDKLIREIEFDKHLNIVKYWNYEWSDSVFSILSSKEAITKFNIKYKENDAIFTTKLFWKHNILNLTWVISLCYDLWIKTSDIEKYLENIKIPKNTLNVIKTKKFILIDDTYNLSENWLYAWLDAINSFNWNKVLVIDDILELWKESDNIHYVIWKYIASRNNINKILFCWINYGKSFIKWLIDWWFLKENIIKKLDNIEEKSIILFEWRASKKLLDKLI